MMSLMLAGLVSLSVTLSEAGAEPETYAAAYRTIVDSGKPMVVMVGTDRCSPCQAMKLHVLPELRKRRWFSEIAFVRVNADQEGVLAKRLTGGGPVPQLVMFRKTARGWARRKLVGRHSVETVERFIEQGIALDAARERNAPTRLAARNQAVETERLKEGKQ